MTYKLHKQFNWKSSSARLRKPVSDDDRAAQLRNRLQAIEAKSNIGPNGKPKLKKV
jgi:hypothetical protein